MKRIIVADDAMFMRKCIRDVLEEGGYEVVAEAKNGREAVEKHSIYEPDIITMDITMPELDGIQALRVINSNSRGTKVIMVSAMGQEHLVKEAAASGAKGFIIKPFKKEKVLRVIKEALSEE